MSRRDIDRELRTAKRLVFIALLVSTFSLVGSLILSARAAGSGDGWTRNDVWEALNYLKIISEKR